MKVIFKVAVLASGVFAAQLALASNSLNDTHDKKQESAVTLCSISEHRLGVDEGCRDGDQVAWLPSAATTNRNAIVFAARYCNLEKGIILERLGVVCTYQKKTMPDSLFDG